MSISDSENAAQAAVTQASAIITRWKAFAIDQRVIDLANRYLLPVQADEFIQSARAGLVDLDMDNQLSMLAATLEKI
jgi:hypothetical protein